jgi:Asp-tRNA(Asn)/Glu-tRNA(Gln) amidotransferase B subunit
LNVDNLAKQLVDAALSSGKTLFEKARTFLVPELQQVAMRIAAIEISVRDGEISAKIAKELMVMQVDSAVDVIVAMTELTVFQAEILINAALKAVKDVVNTAIGFRLL